MIVKTLIKSIIIFNILYSQFRFDGELRITVTTGQNYFMQLTAISTVYDSSQYGYPQTNEFDYIS